MNWEWGSPGMGMDRTRRTIKTDNRPLLLLNIGQLLTLCSSPNDPGPRRGAALSDLGIIEHAAVLCSGGKIVSVGKATDVLHDQWLKNNRKRIIEIDCKNKVVLPGFVDSHTHPAFISPRLTDFEKRISGATYEEIAKGGGGIRSSVEDVRKASKVRLSRKILDVLNQIADHGTTTVEAKSGYGLTLASELKSLEAIREAASRWPGTVVPTLLAAHVVPQEFTRDDYVSLVCNQIIPLVAKRKRAQFVDVFIERGAFTLNEGEEIFRAARKHSLGIRAHVCQLGAQALRSVLEFDPTSLDHLDFVTDEDIWRLAAGRAVATLLPAANYFLGLDKFPPARKLIDGGVPVALATDYNPGSSPTVSMPLILSLACTQMRVSPAEAIAAATINGAWSLRLQDRKGSIEPGKDADFAGFDFEDYREIPYWFGSNRAAFTILNGVIRSASDTQSTFP